MPPALRHRAARLLLSLGLLLAFGCSGGSGADTTAGGNGTKPPIVYGKVRNTTAIDGDTREYYVHVPLIYDGKTAVPVVFMFHGTSGDGEKFYNISGWKEKAERENFIAVFPSSWHYCFTEDGQVHNNTKWNDFTLPTILCAGETGRNDVKFVGQMITEVQATYNINAKRVYASGFSNGGQFSSRLAVDLSDKIAAVASNSGSLRPGAVYTPKRLLPVAFMVGNLDDRFMATNNGNPLPMDMAAFFAVPYLGGVANTYIQSFGLNPAYTLSGVPGVTPIATFAGTGGRPENVFHVIVVKDLTHLYPNGENFPLSAPDRLWDFFKQYTLP
jgi:polyhydroxybutyrate depolymerase